MIDINSAWYLMFAAYGLVAGWAVVSGLKHD